MDCRQCQTANPPAARFCIGCGAPLAPVCPGCRAEVPPQARFCPQCGHALQPQPTLPTRAPVTAAAPQAPTPMAQPAASTPRLHQYIPPELLSKLEYARAHGGMMGERRTVTMLFCDVKGSTAAASTMDPEEWAEIMKGAFEYLIAPVYKYEGTLARLMGDAVLAFFGAPIAHEDDPQRAVLAGLDILEGIRPHREQVRRKWDLDFDVRIGINTGLVVVGEVGSDLRVEYTAMGDAVNLAARMEQTARPGSVQVTEHTYRLVAPLFDAEDLGGVEVKGKAEPVRSFRILRAKPEPRQLRGIEGLRSTLVGRDREMATLLSLAGGLREGRGGIVSVMGEAGLGKSRLVAELRNALGREGLIDAPGASMVWHEGRSLSYRTSAPYAPFVDLLGRCFRFEPEDSDEQRYARVASRLSDLLPDRATAVAPFLGSLFGLRLEGESLEKVRYLEPPMLRKGVFDAVEEFVRAAAAERPLLLVFEDIHWADSTSLDLLERLFPATDRAPVLLLAAFRPQRQEPSWRFHEVAARDYEHRYTAIALEPLSEDQTRTLVANLLHIEGLPEKVRQMILRKAEGNPFFVEEVIRSLLDTRVVVQDGAHWRATREIEELSVPDTIAGVLTTRLDRLEEESRRVLQTAAVLGREFHLDVLADVYGSRDTLDVALTDLQRRGLVRERARVPRPVFVFKHSLVQETAYSSLLLSHRRELHRRAAESILRTDPRRVTDIARHFYEAREYARALPHLIEAGEAAARAYSTREAMGFFRQAIGALASADDPALARRAFEGLGGVLTFANDPQRALETYQQMREYAQAHGDMPMEVSALNKMAFVLSLRMGQMQEAERRLDESERVATQCRDYPGLVELHMTHCYINTTTGRFENAMQHLEESARLGQDLGMGEARLFALTHIVQVLLMMTRFEDSYRTAQEALAIARELGHRGYEADVLGLGVPFYHIRNGDLDAAREAAQRALAISKDIGALYTQCEAAYTLGAVAQMRGEYEDALALHQEALGAARAAGAAYLETLPLCSLGTVLLALGKEQVQKAMEYHRQLVFVMQQPLGIAYGAMAWADLGFCALELGDVDAASDYFQKGLNVPTAPMYIMRPQLLLGCAFVALARGQTDEALARVREARAYAEERSMRHAYAFVSLADGMALAAVGRREEAVELLRRAEEQAATLGMRPVVWQARAGQARALAAMGRAEEAQAKRRGALATVNEMASLFRDPSLRGCFLESAMAKLG